MASDVLLCFVVLTGCGAGGAPAVTPSVIAVDDQSQPLHIGDLTAADYLTTSSDRLALVANYRATIGGGETVVGIADASGVTVTLVQPLAIGEYALDLIAGSRAWHVDNALAVVPSVTAADGGVGDGPGGDAVADAGVDAPPDASPDAPPDASPDAPPDAPVDAMPPCFGSRLVQVCPTVTPTGALDLDDGQIDTDNSPLCASFASPNGTTGCLVAANAITENGGVVVTAIGSRPLILLAVTTITVTGSAVIDVASHVGGSVGAGSLSSCTPGALPSGVGGGYGASFGGRGGGGGASGGTSPPVPAITSLTGGCAGSDGAGATPGGGGRGGGAVYLLAGTALTISGGVTIDASGASGRGANAGGAGGGGSGGSIGIEAPVITISGGARLFANGGAGGGGSSLAGGAAGTDSTSPTTAAVGGAGGALLGGDGGGGSHGTTLSGSAGGGLLGGGGGGGGGAGVITVHGTTLMVSVVPSPPAS